jgi:cyclophilin family peptidyl-prolyl cis-trans isomerase/HEAT repeat protein
MLPVIVFLILPFTSVTAQEPASLRERMLLAEDARAQTDAELATLRQGLTHHDPAIRRQAVRAIGRLERPDLIPSLTRVLVDKLPDVRIEAANAVGQLARGPKGVADAKTRLLARARAEGDPRVWAAIAATLGRLAYVDAADVSQAEAAIARVLPGGAATSIQIDAVLGAVEGLEALARQSGKIARLKPTTLDGLRAASALEGRPQDADKLARIRRLATQALTAAGAVVRPQLEAGIADADEEVRRLTMVAARAENEGREEVIRRGLSDTSPRVRYEALQTWGRAFQSTSCEPIMAAVRDSSKHVSLLAIDLLGNPCPEKQQAVDTLRALAEIVLPQTGEWHGPAHALVALAKAHPIEARKLLPRYIAHRTWQVRMYAAHAAGALAAVDELEQLGRDTHHNVCEAAVGELIVLRRAEAAELALEAIARSDYQLVITASRALATPAAKTRAAPALLQALARITAEKRDTSRDARLALLDRLKEIGWPDGSGLTIDPVKALGPYLLDFDPAVATRTAEILQAWQKTAVATPQLLPRPPVSQARTDDLGRTRLRFVMVGRGVFDLRLRVDEAPLSALRVATRAREGYYNGLTFHRVVPNFVIQGGSPGANEYHGDGPFMRDEVGLLSHRRGTVGISTRGRDTGDAQIFINLVDLPRLDHNYTVFAEVVSGMDVVDAVLEGDVIERVEIVPEPSQ